MLVSLFLIGCGGNDSPQKYDIGEKVLISLNNTTGMVVMAYSWNGFNTNWSYDVKYISASNFITEMRMYEYELNKLKPELESK